MSDNQFSGHPSQDYVGLCYLGIIGLGEIMQIIANASTLQYVGSVVTVIGGVLASVHYALLIREKVLTIIRNRKSKKPS